MECSPSRAEHYTLSKAQLKCYLPATVSLAPYLSLDYNCSWHPGQLSVFADGMAWWPLACAYYRAPHQVKHQREPSRSSSSCTLASFRAETILFTLLNCCGFASAQWSQERGQFASDLLSQPQLDGQITSLKLRDSGFRDTHCVSHETLSKSCSFFIKKQLVRTSS